MAQGYFLSRPITQDALFTLLEESPERERWESPSEEINDSTPYLPTDIRYLTPLQGVERRPN